MGKGRDNRKKKKAAANGPAAAPARPTNSAKAKKQTKRKLAELGEPEEDIDALLADFCREQADHFKTTETPGCPPPSRRCNASLSTNPLNPSELIFFGGEYYDGQKMHVYNDLFKYNTEKNEWRSVSSPNSPGPRSSHQTVCTPTGRMFLWGGEFVSPNETSFFHWKEGMWMMDLKTNVWEKLDMRSRPPPRSGHRMVLWKHLIVMFGGFFDTAAETRYYDDTWVFDCLDFKWTKLEIPEPRPTARSGFQFLAHNDTVTLFGGYTKTYAKGKKVVGTVHSDVWTLKMSTQLESIRWERRKKPGGHAPSVRSGCTMAVHKGRGILFGGVSDVQETEETIESVCQDDAYQLNIEANRWFPVTLRAAKTAKQQEKRALKAQQRQNQRGRDARGDQRDDNAGDGMSDGDEHDQDVQIRDVSHGRDDSPDGSNENSQGDQEMTTVKPTATPAAPGATNAPLQPCARFNAMLTVSRNSLYLYGGILEKKSREITLCDFWSLNLDKMQEWVQIIPDDVYAAEWVDESSDDDSDDDEEDDGSEDDDEDGDEEDDDDDAMETDSTLITTKQSSNTTPDMPKTPSKQKEGGASDTLVIPANSVTSSMHSLSIADDHPVSVETEEERLARIAFEPLPEETLRQYYERTSVQWQIRARDETDATGKALRRDAFELAQEYFDKMQPQLEHVRKLLRENESAGVSAGGGGDGAAVSSSRHRR